MPSLNVRFTSLHDFDAWHRRTWLTYLLHCGQLDNKHGSDIGVQQCKELHVCMDRADLAEIACDSQHADMLTVMDLVCPGAICDVRHCRHVGATGSPCAGFTSKANQKFEQRNEHM